MGNIRTTNEKHALPFFAIVLPPKFSAQKILNSEQTRQAKYRLD